MRTVRAVAAAVVLVLVGGSPPWSRTAGRRRGRGLRVTAAGSCFDLTLRQTRAPSTREVPVDCSRHHTLLVTAVAASRGAGLELLAAPEIIKAVMTICPPAQGQVIGRKPAAALPLPVPVVLLHAHQRQKSVGARWFDCMTGVAEDTKLTNPPLNLTPLSNHMPGRHRPVRDGDLHSTTCADTHVALLLGFYARGRPTKSAVKRAANRPPGARHQSRFPPGWTSPVGATSWAATPRRCAPGSAAATPPGLVVGEVGMLATHACMVIAAADEALLIDLVEPNCAIENVPSHAARADRRARASWPKRKQTRRGTVVVSRRERAGQVVDAGTTSRARGGIFAASAGTSEWCWTWLVAVGDHRPRRFQRRLPTMWTRPQEGVGVRTIVPMLKSCCQFSIATWKSCRRVSRSATIASTVQ